MGRCTVTWNWPTTLEVHGIDETYSVTESVTGVTNQQRYRATNPTGYKAASLMSQRDPGLTDLAIVDR